MSKSNFFIIIILLSSASICLNPFHSIGGDWEFETGLKYNVVLQKSGYFEADTFSSTTEYMYYFSPEYEAEFGNNKITSTSLVSAGSKTLRGQLELEYEYKSDLIKWELSDRIDGRLYHTAGESDRTYGKNYLKSYFKLYKGKYEIGNTVWLESKRYKVLDDYRYNYDLAKVELSVSRELGENNELKLSYQYGSRSVQDSSEANYNKHIGRLFWESWFGLGNFVTFDLEVEGRDYLSPGEEDDYNNIYAVYNGTYYVGLVTSIYSEYEFESRDYEGESFVHSDYYVHSINAGPQFQVSTPLRLGFAPQVEYANSDSAAFGDAYTELGIELQFDYMKYKKIWVNLVYKPGYRWYNIEDDIYEMYSNYSFHEIMLLFDWWFFKNTRLNITATYYPESHENDEDDMTTSYISAKVEYEF
ncbi:hypothetical protein JXI42_00905 [bacterium]|nr:hypothetical protein [bacterium]